MPPLKEIGSSLLSEKQFDEVDATEIHLDSGLEPGSGYFLAFQQPLSFLYGETLLQFQHMGYEFILAFSSKAAKARKVFNEHLQVNIEKDFFSPGGASSLPRRQLDQMELYKFLIDREGNVIKRFESTDEPLDMKVDIERLL